MLPTLAELRFSDLVDMAIVATLIFVLIVWFRASRARLALMGLAALGSLYGVARGLDLQLTTWLLQGFFAVAALMLVVVFQDELRRLFEGIAVWGLRRGVPRSAPDVQRNLVRVCFRLAESKIGALLVLPGREPIERHLDGGSFVGGRVSEPLLLSLFDPRSPGHDGAVVVRGNQLVSFGVHLPLSTDWEALSGVGTRHAAALGLAERSDALCLVVSEERGEVSVAQRGRLETVTAPERLARVVERFQAKTASDPTATTGWRGLGHRLSGMGREAALAVALSALLWFVAVPGATVESTVREVPIQIENLPEGYRLLGVEPDHVHVEFEGQRRDLYLSSTGEHAVHVDGLLAQLGRRTFALSLEDVQHPTRIAPISIDPLKIRIRVEPP